MREISGIFDKAWPCSMQHPTLLQLAASLTENSCITVQMPDAAYSNTPVPHFTHSGTGFQLLNVIGQAFSVPDYIRYQLPDVKPDEQLQQQREEVSQRVTQGGDWVRKTDQTISESSMSRVVTADNEQRTVISRETTVKATDKLTVLGTATLMAGAIQQVTMGDYSQGIKGNRLASVGGDDETDVTGNAALIVGSNLVEKIGQLRQSIAGQRQEIIAPVVWIGTGKINAAQLVLDTLDLLQQLASHTHPDTGQPTNSAAIPATGAQAGTLTENYSPIIG